MIRVDQVTKAAFDMYTVEAKVRLGKQSMKQWEAMRLFFEEYAPEYLERARVLLPNAAQEDIEDA